MKRRAVGLAALLVVIAACQATAGPSSRTELIDAGSPVRYVVPPGWQAVTPATLRDQLDAGLKGGVTGDVADAWTWGRDEVDRGHVVGVVTGPSEVRNATASVVVFVLDPPASLQAGAASALAAAPGGIPEPSLETIRLPIGEALHGRVAFSPKGGTPSQAVMYFTLLPDGRLLWLNGAAPDGDGGFVDLVQTFATSLAAP